MKRLLFSLMISAVMLLMACGGQTKNGTSDADSTQVLEVPDTLNTVEAVVKQVDAVYAYWNELREHYDENAPTVDERFGTKEWQQVREDAWAADRDCECGGFFDFGDEGPLDYDFLLARRLVSGVDIWMNTPTRPLEASGTSGEKAEMNGVVNLSVKDGWWLEGYREGAGWALTEKRTYQNQGYQDNLDAATIYGLLENEIVPLYYNKDKKGISKGWIKVIKNSIAQIAPHYTMKRQLDDYYEKFYNKEAKRFKEISKDGYRLAKEIAQWKEAVAERWDAINVVSCEWDYPSTGIETAQKYTLRYVINEQGLDDAVALEKVNVYINKEGEERIFSIEPLKMVGREGNNFIFEATLAPQQAGDFKSAVRMYPKNKNLPHRQDFCYIKWLELPNFNN